MTARDQRTPPQPWRCLHCEASGQGARMGAMHAQSEGHEVQFTAIPGLATAVFVPEPRDLRAPEPIRPALTAEEWARGEFRAAIGENPQVAAFDREVRLLRFHDAATADRGRHTSFAFPREFFAVMAFANAALPDSDPRKLTRAMADACREASEEGEVRSSVQDTLAHLAELIDALLPEREAGR